MLAAFFKSIRDTVRVICTPSPPATPAPPHVLDLPCGCLPSPAPSSSTIAELMKGVTVHSTAVKIKPKDDHCHCTTIQPLRRLSLVDALDRRESAQTSKTDEPKASNKNSKSVRRLTLVDAATRRQSVLPSATNRYTPAVESSLSTPVANGVDEVSFEYKERSMKRQGRILLRDCGKINELFPCGMHKIDSANYKPETIEEKMKRKHEHLRARMDNFKTHYNLEPIVTLTARGASKRDGFIMPRPDSDDKKNVSSTPPTSAHASTCALPSPVTAAGPKTLFATLSEECNEYLMMVNASQDGVDTSKTSSDGSSLSSPSSEASEEKVASSHCCSHKYFPSIIAGEKGEKRQGSSMNVKKVELGQRDDKAFWFRRNTLWFRLERTSDDDARAGNTFLRFISHPRSNISSLFSLRLFSSIKPFFTFNWAIRVWGTVGFAPRNTGSAPTFDIGSLSVIAGQHVGQGGVIQAGHLYDTSLLDMAERGMLQNPMA